MTDAAAPLDARRAAAQPDAAIVTDAVPVARTALVAHTGPVGARHGWLVLHGILQRAADFIRPWARIEGREGRRVLAPEGLSRIITDFETDATGACWTTMPDRDIEMRDAFAWLDLCWQRLEVEAGDGARVLVGFSQGSIVAARWAVARGRVFDAVLLWGGVVPSDVDAAALAACSRDGAVHIVAGSRDVLADEERRAKQYARLEAAGVRLELTTFEGGHRLDDATLTSLAATLEAR